MGAMTDTIMVAAMAHPYSSLIVTVLFHLIRTFVRLRTRHAPQLTLRSMRLNVTRWVATRMLRTEIVSTRTWLMRSHRMTSLSTTLEVPCGTQRRNCEGC